MNFQKTSSRNAPSLAVCWPACDAKTVHVTFSRSNWETPGIELERQPDGEFMCIMGATDPFEEILFKFIIDGTKWEVNHSLPVILDECGYENNRWTPSEATAYHDFCVLRLRKRITLARVNQLELCQLALSIHGKFDKDGRQLECVVDEAIPGIDIGMSQKTSMSGLFSESFFLRFQPLSGQFDAGTQEDQLESTNGDEMKDDPKGDEMTNGIKIPKGRDGQDIFTVRPRDKDVHADEIWVAKFPIDSLLHSLDGCKSTSEKERRMESECTTMRFLNEHTKIPAPQIYAYDVRYAPSPDAISRLATGKPDANTNNSATENKVGWPFILMEKLEAMSLPPYWPHMGNSCVNDPLSLNESPLRKKIWGQIANFQLELAKHPIAACGYLTLNCFKWQIKSERSTRKKSTPKTAFGIRPCIYDTCMPFTNSIVSAFDGFAGRPLFPPARASNSLNSLAARFQHLLTHDTVENRDHFVALWQLHAMVYDIFGARYENGPFILQHPDLLPRNILVTEKEEKSLTISGTIDWEDTQAVPIQIAACPPKMCLGRLRNDSDDELLQGTNLFQTSVFPEEVLSRYRHEYRTSIITLEDHMVKAGHEPAIWKGFEGIKIYLSQVLREEMILPVYILDELCSGSMYKPPTGDTAVKYFPLIYQLVKGYEWEDVKEAVLSKGAMQMALKDWEEKQEREVASDLAGQV